MGIDGGHREQQLFGNVCGGRDGCPQQHRIPRNGTVIRCRSDSVDDAVDAVIGHKAREHAQYREQLGDRHTSPTMRCELQQGFQPALRVLFLADVFLRGRLRLHVGGASVLLNGCFRCGFHLADPFIRGFHCAQASLIRCSQVPLPICLHLAPSQKSGDTARASVPLPS